MIYAVINSEGLVINAVEWDGSVGWQPPSDCTIQPMTEGGIGWTYADGAFVPPAPPTPIENSPTE